MAKRYEYDGQIFCEDDLSEDVENYGGDLYDLYWELKKDGSAYEHTLYSAPFVSEREFDSVEELIEECFDELEVNDE